MYIEFVPDSTPDISSIFTSNVRLIGRIYVPDLFLGIDTTPLHLPKRFEGWYNTLDVDPVRWAYYKDVCLFVGNKALIIWPQKKTAEKQKGNIKIRYSHKEFKRNGLRVHNLDFEGGYGPLTGVIYPYTHQF